MKNLAWVVVLAAALGLPLTTIGDTETRTIDPVATFSILGYDPESGLLGAVVQSRVFSVGNGVLWGQAAGGDTRGMQSAAMLIVKEDGASGSTTTWF
jgi:uncharacterized Ntn-hydrolase superfamily protein